ncbi:RNA polymerase sigma factor SigJ [Mycobacterium tuberculosis]|nr:RNA polymerase sigma factor SigJ [Mycobacterium tuberculosis]
MTSMEVSEFEALRQHLMSVAYRLTGTVADAEDIVQEAWLRWDSQDTVIADPRAWLTTVVSRLGLDKLRSAAHRRETYTGTWLPEPVVTGLDATDPLAAVVAAEDARFAAMVVLERLRPDQRVAFVLHDGFAVPFAEVAEVLGTSEAAARQLASRARKAVTAQPALISGDPDPAHNEVVGRLMAAMAAGDLDTVVSLLHPDVTFTGDSNGKAPQRYGPSADPTRWSGSYSGWSSVTARGSSARISWRWSTESSAPTRRAYPGSTGIGRWRRGSPR